MREEPFRVVVLALIGFESVSWSARQLTFMTMQSEVIYAEHYLSLSVYIRFQGVSVMGTVEPLG